MKGLNWGALNPVRRPCSLFPAKAKASGAPLRRVLVLVRSKEHRLLAATARKGVKALALLRQLLSTRGPR
jgi:hypothetical protein